MNIDLHLRLFSFHRKITISRRWIQGGIILVVVLVAMTAAYWGSVLLMLALIALPFAVAGIYFFIKQPNLTYLLILVGGMFMPLEGPGGINASILGLLLLVFLWVMDMLVVKKEFHFIYTPAIRPLLYFMIISVVAFAVGQISWFPFANQAPMDAQIGGFAIYLLLPLTVLVTPHLIKDIYWIKIVFWTFVGLSMIYVTARALGLSIADRVFQHGYVANSMLWTWLVALLLSQAVFNDEMGYKKRMVLFATVAVIFYVALIHQKEWTSGWVPPLVSVAIILGLRFKRIIPYLIPLGLAAAIYFAQFVISMDASSWSTRLDIWSAIYKMSLVSPVFGLGFANYYWYAKLVSMWGWHVRFNSHSQYVDLIAQTGFAGLICFFWLFFELGRLGWNLAKRLPNSFARAYAYGTLAGMVGSLMAGFLVDWVLPFPYNIGLDGVRGSILPWIFFGGLISIEQIYAEKPKVTGLQSIRERWLR